MGCVYDSCSILLSGQDVSMKDDFNSPNRKPGFCPVCGEPLRIYDAIVAQFECSLCDWKGVQGDLSKEFDRYADNRINR